MEGEKVSDRQCCSRTETFIYFYLFLFVLSRERNRQHARNTRERKKLLIENYEKRIEGLMAEVRLLSFSTLSGLLLHPYPTAGETERRGRCEDR